MSAPITEQQNLTDQQPMALSSLQTEKIGSNPVEEVDSRHKTMAVKVNSDDGQSCLGQQTEASSKTETAITTQEKLPETTTGKEETTTKENSSTATVVKSRTGKKEDKKKSKKKEDKENVMRALSSLQSSEEKLAALCKKYTDLHEEHSVLQSSFKTQQRSITMQLETLHKHHNLEKEVMKTFYQSMIKDLQEKFNQEAELKTKAEKEMAIYAQKTMKLESLCRALQAELRGKKSPASEEAGKKKNSEQPVSSAAPAAAMSLSHMPLAPSTSSPLLSS